MDFRLAAMAAFAMLSTTNCHRQLQTNRIQPLQVPPHGVFIRGVMPEHAAFPRQNTLEKIVPESYPLAGMSIRDCPKRTRLL